MPIPVVCPGCKIRFNVSEKFAGKKGPCPKCKTIIAIPAEAQPEVKIHVPEQYASAGKDRTGRAIAKPIPRQETKIKPNVVAAVGGCVLVVLVLCLVLRSGLRDSAPGLQYIIVGVGLALISPPLAVAGYLVLRDPELEAYRGRSLWIRAALCGAAYALLWALYIPLRISEVTGEPYQWLLVAPVFIGIGGGAALAAFDLDYTTGAIHYCFFLIVTLMLRSVIGLPYVWAVI
jgi:hypothetical protein